MLQSDREGAAQEGCVFAHEGEASGPSGGNLSQSAGPGGAGEQGSWKEVPAALPSQSQPREGQGERLASGGTKFPHAAGGWILGSSRAPLKFLQCGAVPSVYGLRLLNRFLEAPHPLLLPSNPGDAAPVHPEDQTAPPGPGQSSPKPRAFLSIWSIWGQLTPPGFGSALTPRSKSLNPLPPPHGKLRGRL